MYDADYREAFGIRAILDFLVGQRINQEAPCGIVAVGVCAGQESFCTGQALPYST